MLAALAAGEAPGDRDAVRVLASAGIIGPGEGCEASDAQFETATGSALEMPPPDDERIALAQAALALGEAMARIRWTSFSRLIAWLHVLKSPDHRAAGLHQDRAVAFAQAYDRARLRIPISRICLRDSAALFALLSRRGIDCQLIFGVQLDPFKAHCWVQSGSTILSDTLDSARSMRPILTI
ncbi:lasso peptide biosynthesis B2 protein [Nostoc sp. 3335mG]|nr:lasso peptide biosynthesis B2 protein [Nostoc sp. 3335mG]